MIDGKQHLHQNAIKSIDAQAGGRQILVPVVMSYYFLISDINWIYKSWISNDIHYSLQSKLIHPWLISSEVNLRVWMIYYILFSDENKLLVHVLPSMLAGLGNLSQFNEWCPDVLCNMVYVHILLKRVISWCSYYKSFAGWHFHLWQQLTLLWYIQYFWIDNNIFQLVPVFATRFWFFTFGTTSKPAISLRIPLMAAWVSI